MKRVGLITWRVQPFERAQWWLGHVRTDYFHPYCLILATVPLNVFMRAGIWLWQNIMLRTPIHKTYADKLYHKGTKDGYDRGYWAAKNNLPHENE